MILLIWVQFSCCDYLKFSSSVRDKNLWGSCQIVGSSSFGQVLRGFLFHF